MQSEMNQVDRIVEQILLNIKKHQNGQALSKGEEGVLRLQDEKEALRQENRKEVGIGIAPAFDKEIHKTIGGLDLKDVMKEMMAGIEEEGMIPRVIRITRTSDVSFIGNDTAKLCGSGIAIGIQSKGTAVIHQKDLYPLTNLELFPQAPLLTLDMYRLIGKNAARYAKGEQVTPVEIQNDPMVRPKFQVKAALMHALETESVVNRGKPIEVRVNHA